MSISFRGSVAVMISSGSREGTKATLSVSIWLLPSSATEELLPSSEEQAASETHSAAASMAERIFFIISSIFIPAEPGRLPGVNTRRAFCCPVAPGQGPIHRGRGLTHLLYISMGTDFNR